MINFKIKGIDDAIAKFEKIGKIPKDKKTLTRIGHAVKKVILKQFEASVDPYGNPWKPVKRTRNGGKPLVDTGFLKKSIIFRTDQGMRLTFTANAEYGAYHQNGVGVAQRPFFPTSRGVPESYIREARRVIEDSVRAALA